MTIVRYLDVGKYIETLHSNFRIPGEDYEFKFPIYDIAAVDKSKLIFPLYQNNIIASVDSECEEVCIYPFETNHPHGIFVARNRLLVSCYRVSLLQLYRINKLGLIAEIDALDFFPSSSILYQNAIIFIDYLQSQLIHISLDNPLVLNNLSYLLNGIKKPHSIKILGEIFCIACQDPPCVIVLNRFKLTNIFYLPSDWIIMTAIPISNIEFVLVVYGKGVKKISLKTGLVSSILEFADATSVQLLNRYLYITTERGLIIKVANWRS